MSKSTDSNRGDGGSLARLREIQNREAREAKPVNRKAERRVLGGAASAAVGLMLIWLAFNMGWGRSAELWLAGSGAVLVLGSAYPVISGLLKRM